MVMTIVTNGLARQSFFAEGSLPLYPGESPQALTQTEKHLR
jgi:hypothetical protein